MYIKHSKYKNTGILFEVLVKQITSDTLNNKDSQAIKLLKKYFINTELGREYKLYETLFKNPGMTYHKANVVLDTLLEASKKINKKSLKREKYNLVKELKEHYNIDELFRTKIGNYKEYASFYTLLEIYNGTKPSDPNQTIENKVTLLEYITKSEVNKTGVKQDIIKEYENYDKDIRTLTYYVLLEKFNTKYKDLNKNQKQILREFINSVDNNAKLKKFYNLEIQEIKNKLNNHIKITENQATKIKLKEIKNLIKEIDKKGRVKNDHLIDLLHYHSLIEELNQIHS